MVPRYHASSRHVNTLSPPTPYPLVSSTSPPPHLMPSHTHTVMPRLPFRPKRLDDLRVKEVSGVDHPAHMDEGWLVRKAKNDQGTELPDNEINKEALDPAVLAYVEEVEAELTKAETELTKALDAAKTAEAIAADAQAKLDAATATLVPEPQPADTLEKALEALPEPLRKAFEQNQRDALEAVEKARKLEETAEISAFTKAAEAYPHLPSVTPAEFGPVLRDIAKNAPDSYGPLVEVLKAAEGAIATSALFSEHGSSAAAPADGSAQAQLEALGKAIAESENISLPEAIAKAADANPTLYTQHLAEQRARAIKESL